jgi:hypothetical protein
METLETQADAMVSKADETFGAFGDSLKGIGGTVYNDFATVFATARSIAQTGSAAAETAKRIHENRPDQMSGDMKMQKVAAVDSLFTGATESTRRVALAGIDKVEAQLLDAAMPAANSDMRSLLVRQELDALIAAAPKQSMLSTLLDFSRESSEYAAEILGSYGRVKMSQAKEASQINDLHRSVRVRAAMIPGGTPQQQQAKAALGLKMVQLGDGSQALQSNLDPLRGHAIGYLQAAKNRVEAAKPVRGLTMGVAPDTIAPINERPRVTSADLTSKVRGKR